MESNLNEKEKKALDYSGELWAYLLGLEILNDDDTNDYRRMIHDIQARIMARPEIKYQNSLRNKDKKQPVPTSNN